MPPPWGPPRTQENSRRLSSVGTTSVDCSRRTPNSGDGLPAVEAVSPAGQPIVQDSVADPADQGGLAAGAAGVLVSAHPAGQVAGVDVPEAGRPPDAAPPKQGLRRGVVGILHFVVLVEGGDVPGDAGRQAAQEAGDLPQLLVAVVESGDDQGHDLEPEAHLVHHSDAVDDVLELAAQRAVVLVAERLELDLA